MTMRLQAALAGCALAMLAARYSQAAVEPPGAEGIPALERSVHASPQDTDARFALARAYARAGLFADAEREFDFLLAKNADDVDWLLGKSQALVAMQRPREALPLLANARRLAPHYEDVWRTEATALEAAGDQHGALALLASASVRFPGAGWPGERRARLMEERLLTSGTRLSAGVAYEDLSRENEPWRSAFAAVMVPISGSTRLVAALALERRYGRQDEQISAGIAHQLPARWSLDAGVAATPGAELLAKHHAHLELARPMGRRTSAGLRYRRSHYDAVDVDALAASGEYAFGGYRLAYTLTGTRPTDIDVTLGHAVRFARDYGTASNVTALAARGDDAETVSPGRVLVTRVTTLAVYGVHWRSAAWGYSWSASWTEQGDLYERLGVRLGVERRF
jgi:YaiO family outer membrane protein